MCYCGKHEKEPMAKSEAAQQADSPEDTSPPAEDGTRDLVVTSPALYH